MQERLDHLEDPARAGLSDPQLRGEYKNIQHKEAELLNAAEDLKKAYAKTGSANEIEQVRNDVMT